MAHHRLRHGLVNTRSHHAGTWSEEKARGRLKGSVALRHHDQCIVMRLFLSLGDLVSFANVVNLAGVIFGVRGVVLHQFMQGGWAAFGVRTLASIGLLRD